MPRGWLTADSPAVSPEATGAGLGPGKALPVIGLDAAIAGEETELGTDDDPGCPEAPDCPE